MPDGPSTKLITIRAAERLGLKNTIRKYILKRQIAYVKPSVRAVRIPIEELERILAAGLRPAIPQGGCPMSRWKEFRREPVTRGMDEETETGLSPGAVAFLWFWECHQFQVLWVTLSTAKAGMREKLTLSPQAAA